MGGALFFAVLGQYFLFQKDLSWTLGPGLAFFLTAILLFIAPGSNKLSYPLPQGRLSSKAEWTGAVLTGLLALFFRLYHIQSVPPGMTVEETFWSWLGSNVSASHWAEYYPTGLAGTFADVPCLASLWFHLFKPSHLSFSLFYVFLSMLSFPLGYFFFRELSGPATALLTLWFWAVMQWHVSLSRNGHPAITILIYILGALLFHRLAWKQGKIFFWVLAGVFLGLGFYAYPAFRACLLLLPLFLFYEYRLDPSQRRFPLVRVLLLLTVFFAVSGNCWIAMWNQQHWITGTTKDNNFVGRQVVEEKSLRPLWRNISQTLLAFQRTGSYSTQENIPSHRLLDDVTGVLSTLGFFLAAWRWRERKYFYAIVGVTVLSFPCLLSDQPLHTSRMLGVAPFVAYLAALAAIEIWERTASSRIARKLTLGLGIGAALLGVSENFKTYFVDRPQNEACWREAGVAPMKTGQAIAGLGDQYEYYLSPTFFGQYTVLFLGHSQIGHLHFLDTPGCFHYLSPPPERGLFFILQEGRTGVLKVLQGLYPGGVTEKLMDPWSRPYLYFFSVPAEACSPSRFFPLDPARSWKGTYWTSNAQPVLTQSDPVLNYSYRDDFPVKNASSLRVEWLGTLHPEKVGLYHFLMVASDHTKAEMEVNGKKVAALANQEAGFSMERKDYRVVIRYQREGGFESVFHLAWKPPGADHYEIVPPEALK